MHCTTLYSFAAAALFAITAQAAPAPTGVFARQEPAASGLFPRQPQASGVFARQEPEPSAGFQRRQAVPSGIFEKRQAVPSGVFERQVPVPTGGFQRRDGAEAPYPPRNAEPEQPSTASCSSTDDKAPQYTITIPADIAEMDSFGSCGQNLVDAIQAGGDPVFGFGCRTNSDGGVTLTFSSAGEIASGIDLALTAVSENNFPEDALCKSS